MAPRQHGGGQAALAAVRGARQPVALTPVLAHAHGGAAIAGSEPAVVALLGAALVLATVLGAAVLLGPLAVGRPAALRVVGAIAMVAAFVVFEGGDGAMAVHVL